MTSKTSPRKVRLGRIFAFTSLVSALSLMGSVSAQAETLSGERQGTTGSSASSVLGFDLWNLHGLPVKSFFFEDRAYFTLDDQHRLWVYIQPEFDGSLQTIHLHSDVIAAEVGYDYLLFLKSDQSLWRQDLLDGRTADGLFGINFADPVLVSTDVKALAAGKDHYLFIKTDGSLMGAGYNAVDGRFGVAGRIGNTDPMLVASNVIDASAGHGFSVYLKADHTMWGTGVNNRGQIGLGDAPVSYIPVKIADNVAKVGAELVASWFISQNDALYFMGKGVKTPMGIAEGVQHAVVTANEEGSYGTDIWVHLKERDEVILGTVVVPDPTNRHWTSWGTEIRGIVSCNQGVFLARKGTPLARYTVPTSDGEALAAPFDVIEAGSSFITANKEEAGKAAEILERNYTFQRVLMGPENGAKPVYRFLNTSTYNHIHTLVESEIAQLENNASFLKEGVAFYAYDFPFDGTVPVYRFYMPQCNGFYYVIGDIQRDYLLEHYGTDQYVLEGIAWYAYSFFGF